MEYFKADVWSELELLVREKDYHSLTEQEKLWVDKHIDSAEYQKWRHLLLYSQTCLKEEIPDLKPAPQTRNVLLDAVKQKQKQKKWIINKILMYPVPAYRAAAAVLLLAVGIHWINLDDNNPRNFRGTYPMIVDTAHVPPAPAGWSPDGDTVDTMLMPVFN